MFQFQQFAIHQNRSALKVGTDAMVLGALIDAFEKNRALDIGAGTGVLSLMVAQKSEFLTVDAIEIDHPSFLDCKDNFDKSTFSQRVNIFQDDFLHWKTDHKYDLIFSNPPFYSNGLTSETIGRARAKHASFLPFEKLFERVIELLTCDGSFWLIVPYESTDVVHDKANSKGLFLWHKVRIDGKPSTPKRCVLQFGLKKQVVCNELLTIRNLDGSYTHEYTQLTVDYHVWNQPK